MVQLKRPQAILLDVVGPFAMKEFHTLSNEKRRFYKQYIREFVNDPKQWHRKSKGHLKLHYNFAHTLQSRRELNKNEPKLSDPKESSREERGASLVKYILWSIDSNPNDPATGLFLEYLQAWGYARGALKTQVYDDVPVCLKKWKEEKIQILLNIASEEIFERIVSATTKGNLRGFFSGHCRPEFGTKKGVEVFNGCRLVFPIQNPRSLLFITHSAKEANNAFQSGIPCVLIVRKDLDPEFEKRMADEKKTWHPEGSGIDTFQTAPITNISPLSGKSFLDAGIPDIDIEEISSQIKDTANVESQGMSSTISYGDTTKFTLVKSLTEITFAS